jgi:hypothetical protein
MSITLNGTTGITAPTGAPLTAANGGTGAATLTANNVLLGNGTSAVQFVAPGTNGNVLTSNGTTWASTAPSGGVTSVNSQSGAVVTTSLYSIGMTIAGRPADGSDYSVGYTIAGSSLYSTPIWESSYYVAGGGFYLGGVPITSGTLINTGSWRAVTRCYGDGSAAGRSGLWVRYA